MGWGRCRAPGGMGDMVGCSQPWDEDLEHPSLSKATPITPCGKSGSGLAGCTWSSNWIQMFPTAAWKLLPPIRKALGSTLPPPAMVCSDAPARASLQQKQGWVLPRLGAHCFRQMAAKPKPNSQPQSTRTQTQCPGANRLGKGWQVAPSMGCTMQVTIKGIPKRTPQPIGPCLPLKLHPAL